MSVSIRCVTLFGFRLDERVAELGLTPDLIYDKVEDQIIDFSGDETGKIGLIMSDGITYFGYVTGHTSDEQDGSIEMIGGDETSIGTLDLSVYKGEVWRRWQNLVDELGIYYNFDDEDCWLPFPSIKVIMTVLYN